MKKIIQPCGLHCIKMQDIGVTIGEQTILQHVNLHIHCGTLAAVIGKRCGKINADQGDPWRYSAQWNHRVQRPRKRSYAENEDRLCAAVAEYRKKTPISVYDMIASYQSRYPVFWKKSKKVYAKIKEHLAIFKAEDLIDKQVCNLSGGELQRVLLSMAVMDEPNLLLLDEPVSGIDQNGMDLFYHTISELKKHYDLAIILISHDLDYVAQYADQVILIDGTVKKQGTVRQVYESEEFRQVFGRFDLENYKPSRQVKEQQEKKITMPKHSYGLWKEEE